MFTLALETAGVGAFAGLVLSVGSMLVLRRLNWYPDGTRRFSAKGGSRRSEEIEHHNLAIYRDFEYFFKVTLALLAGIAFVATRPDTQRPSYEILQALLGAGGALQLVAGLAFSLFIFFHQKSKIERWETRFGFWGPMAWQECWMVAVMFAVSGAISFAAVRELLAIFGRQASAG